MDPVRAVGTRVCAQGIARAQIIGLGHWRMVVERLSSLGGLCHFNKGSIYGCQLHLGQLLPTIIHTNTFNMGRDLS